MKKNITFPPPPPCKYIAASRKKRLRSGFSLVHHVFMTAACAARSHAKNQSTASPQSNSSNVFLCEGLKGDQRRKGAGGERENAGGPEEGKRERKREKGAMEVANSPSFSASISCQHFGAPFLLEQRWNKPIMCICLYLFSTRILNWQLKSLVVSWEGTNEGGLIGLKKLWQGSNVNI